ncbi:MAG: hypothetical protein ACI9TV_002235 [Sulfurimonas sp.]|jgi:hypothetical protein|uniref:hypothetical protein n=1 Tax=Sulfurimonas sp. TaxID=2022749 RepID=UPI0039E707E9
MFNLFTKLILSVSLVVTLQAESGLTQQDLISVSPQNLSDFEFSDTVIEIAFSKPILVKSVHKNTVVLKTDNNKRLSGVATVLSDTLFFKPDTLLEVGTYEVLVSKMKLENPPSQNTMTEKINYTFTVVDIQSISIDTQSTELKEGTQTTLSVLATLANGTSKDISNRIEWIIQDTSIVSITNNTLSGLKEDSTTIQAKFNNILSEPIQIVVYTEINGYKLPPEPDPVINNSTILGVDFNNNGVRDDVERFIVSKYKDNHVIVSEIGLQGARAYQMIVDNPLNKEENHKALHDAMDCNFYFKDYSELYGDPILVDHSIRSTFHNLQLNTKSRVQAYMEYDKQMSGGVYTLTLISEQKSKCAFDVNTLLGVQ